MEHFWPATAITLRVFGAIMQYYRLSLTIIQGVHSSLHAGYYISSGTSDDGNVDACVRPDENIELKGRHMTADKEIIVNTVDCIRYHTANADLFTILGSHNKH